MKSDRPRSEHGFTLVEVVLAMALTLVVMGAIYGLLTRGRQTFRREPEVSSVQQNVRWGLERISADLAMAGFKTPGACAVLWSDAGGINPDQITIIYADPDIPISEPLKCGEGGQGPCDTIDRSSTLFINPATMDPYPADPAEAYSKGMTLFAIEKGDCNDDGQVGIYPFEVTQPPTMTNASGTPTLNINHNSGNVESELNAPGGFNRLVHPDCAVVGRYHVIQYRVSPFPTEARPGLERRDLAEEETWTPVSDNIENLQFQYVTNVDSTPVDAPPAPDGADPLTWVARVTALLAGRSESVNLEGGSPGVFSQSHTHLRRTYSTSVNLRNTSLRVEAANP